jgi:hypothetical protein
MRYANTATDKPAGRPSRHLLDRLCDLLAVMWWLMRRLRGRDREHGGTTVLVATLLAGGVLVGLGAVVIDVGQMYAERAQTQNGADAAALAVARACAANTSGCASASAATGIANPYAVGSANDGHAHVSIVCGSPFSVACPTDRSPRYCPDTPAGNYVEVHTKTGTDSSNTLLTPVFGRAVAGNGYNGKTVGGCAQASWGAPATLGNAAAMTISECEWWNSTNHGTTFATATAPTWPPSFLDTLSNRAFLNNGSTVTYTDPNNETTPDDPPAAPVAGSETLVGTDEANNCAAGHPGWDAPGMFGWLSNSTCSVTISGAEFPGATGNSSAPCEQQLTASRNNRTPIYLPVYSSIDTVTGQYVLAGFAAFVVTGWDVTSGNAGNWSVKKAPSTISTADGTPVNDANYCGKFTGSNSDVCIYGFFTQALVPASALPGGTGGTPLGATSFALSG